MCFARAKLLLMASSLLVQTSQLTMSLLYMIHVLPSVTTKTARFYSHQSAQIHNRLPILRDFQKESDFNEHSAMLLTLFASPAYVMAHLPWNERVCSHAQAHIPPHG
jgi:hypothetical protein